MHAIRSAQSFLDDAGSNGDKKKLEKFETAPGASTHTAGGQPIIAWNQVFTFTRDLPADPAQMRLTFKLRNRGGGAHATSRRPAACVAARMF